jgi:signal transduction histidine kinase
MSLLNYTITSIVTLIIFIIISIVLFGRKGRRHQKKQIVLLDNVIEALEKISQGDFNVLLDTKGISKHDEYKKDFTDIIDSINKMAMELGTMEILRQDFISNVSHEIGSPLTSIKGFASLLRDTNISEEKRYHYLDIIEAETSRLSKLSENFLKLSSLEKPDSEFSKTEFSLDKQLQDIILMMEPQWKKKNQQITLKLDKINVIANQDLLSEVWINILNNSIKFTSEHGKIDVLLSDDKNYIYCTISDNGIGISEQDKMHIFERFYKSDKSRTRSLGGNGLGLAIAKKIIELHNGKITVESELAKGTKIIVTIKK